MAIHLKTVVQLPLVAQSIRKQEQAYLGLACFQRIHNDIVSLVNLSQEAKKVRVWCLDWWVLWLVPSRVAYFAVPPYTFFRFTISVYYFARSVWYTVLFLEYFYSVSFLYLLERDGLALVCFSFISRREIDSFLLSVLWPQRIHDDFAAQINTYTIPEMRLKLFLILFYHDLVEGICSFKWKIGPKALDHGEVRFKFDKWINIVGSHHSWDDLIVKSLVYELQAAHLTRLEVGNYLY